MADQYTPEEIAEIFEAYNNAIKTNTPINAELAKQMKDAAVGAKGYAQAQQNLIKSLGKAAVDYTKEMYKGEQGAKAFNNSIDGVTDALGALALILLPLKGISLITKGVVAGLYALGKATKLAGEQSDKLYKSYQDLSRAGAATAGGMTEVFENMQKFGYGLEELDQMAQLVKANSKELGLFLGTVGQGVRAVADTAESIQRSGIQREFLNMGMKVDDINKGIAGYIVQQGRLGRLQGQTQAELNAGARAYVKEMEILTRLTGQSREEMEQQRAQAESIDQFYAVVSELEPGKAAEVQKVFNQLMAIDPSGSKARGFAESISGFQGFSEDQNKLYMATGGALAANMEALKNGTQNSAQFLDKLGLAIKDNETNLRAFAKTGSGADAFGGLASNMRLANKATLGFEKSAEEAANSLKPLDGVTDTASGMRQSQMQARDSLQSFVQLGVKPATEALAFLAKGGAGGAGMLPGGGGKAPMGGGGAGGGSGKMDYGKELYGRGIGGGGTGGGAAGAPGAGLTGKPLSGVNPGLAQALQQAAAEYNQVTGKTVEVTSAVRDSAKQAELYQAYVSGNSKFPAAPPGTSKHERGLAVDISQAVADDMDRMGLLKKYGLSRPVANDPVHLEVSAANGAILSGPASGYKPNLTMHGTEAIVPLNSPAAQSAFGSSDQTSIMSAQLDKLDELVRVMQNQVSVSTKILQAAN
jgi:D-alanyl-D-alanine dipeptidase